MSENTEAQVHKARIPETLIKNYTALNDRLREIHTLPEDLRPDEYRKLLEETAYGSGGQRTLLDETLEQVTRPDHEGPTKAEQVFEKASERVRAETKKKVNKPGFEGLEVVVDDSGNIKEVLTHKTYPRMDESGQRRMQQSMPSGPGRLTHVPDAVGQKVRT